MIAKWPVFHQPGGYFTVNLNEAGKTRYFENLCMKPVF